MMDMVNHRVSVSFAGAESARTCAGRLLGFDGNMNIALADADLGNAGRVDWAFIVGSNVRYFGVPAE